MEELQGNLNQYKNDLQRALKDMEEMRSSYEHTVHEKSTSIQYLSEDLSIKAKHIEQLEDSYKKAVEMLEQSQNRITELEDNQNQYEKEFALSKQNNSMELQETRQELNDLQEKVKRQEADVKAYDEELQKLNGVYEGAKNKIIQLGDTLKTKEKELLVTTQKVQQREEELVKLKKMNQGLERKSMDENNQLKELQEEKNKINSELDGLRNKVRIDTVNFKYNHLILNIEHYRTLKLRY